MSTCRNMCLNCLYYMLPHWLMCNVIGQDTESRYRIHTWCRPLLMFFMGMGCHIPDDTTPIQKSWLARSDKSSLRHSKYDAKALL